ncbi:thioredoxin-dependent thiol peroxidase [Propionimicrobium lymphophilum]|uniref:thioredoxin-dependent peroxiredoxin n=1 Tax=Propionimicrobium lymphophilum ACS-093-V-SCH5 TaxID=883161 RepID=S2WWE6_9ACTN|nr:MULTISPECIES: thioredoxin-dependent thiol peroxidase [Propionimicrobium]EPD32074.1 hypothetical protein HMPREF9306_01637 [Propionimicrobium lymphophilum ACS-093-V-SCH5]ETJ98375.1 redoxin [Propionimicrobium sp. BV2F7]MDK7710091.1 thioredoxin-dependent thiol peroxidase [Propionimicrobium lymphophilum]MDK7734106.1 thioredoxin-dependent thiol peroxidase [Propionimicrobium lymphophilum]
MTDLKVGDTAPQFSLEAHDGSIIKLSDYKSRKVIVYFYPAAMTPGCTVEAVDFSNAKSQFDGAGVDVIGISPDTKDKLTRFITRDNLDVTLLADPEKETIKAYGAWGVRKIYGKEVTGVIRSTFVVEVDDKGVGTIVEVQRNVRAKGHVSRIGAALGLKLNLP